MLMDDVSLHIREQERLKKHPGERAEGWGVDPSSGPAAAREEQVPSPGQSELIFPRKNFSM